jgi:hypothetical protein
MAILHQHSVDIVYGPGVMEVLVGLLPVPTTARGHGMPESENVNEAEGNPSSDSE